MSAMDWFLVVLVAVCAITDATRDRIYNGITYPAIVVALAAARLGVGAHTLFGTRITLPESCTGFALGFLPFLALWLVRGVGGGDVKLLGAIGAIKGTTFVAHTMLYSLFFGAFLGLVAAGSRGQLGPILRRVGYTLYHSVQPGLGPTVHVDVKGPRINFGPAICLGTWLCLVGQVAGRQVLNL